MAFDPTRRSGTFSGGIAAVSVSVSWLQETLNTLLVGRAPALVVDGRWGTNTQGALAQWVIEQYGGVSGRTVLAVDPSVSPNRVLLPVALERALVGGSAGGSMGTGIGVALLVGAFAWWGLSGRGSSGMRGLRSSAEERPWRVRDRLTRARYFFDTRSEAEAFVADTSTSEITGEPLRRWESRLVVEKNK